MKDDRGLGPRDYLNIVYLVIGLGVLVGGYFLVKKILELINPSGTAGWWANFFGLAKPGTQQQDLTGSLGQEVSDSAQQAAVNAATPQLSYDQARSSWAKARGLSAAWSDLKGNGWPWDSYDQWYVSGMPPLPT